MKALNIATALGADREYLMKGYSVISNNSHRTYSAWFLLSVLDKEPDFDPAVLEVAHQAKQFLDSDRSTMPTRRNVLRVLYAWATANGDKHLVQQARALSNPPMINATPESRGGGRRTELWKEFTSDKANKTKYWY